MRISAIGPSRTAPSADAAAAAHFKPRTEVSNMKRWLCGALGAIVLFGAARPAAAFLYVSGSDARSGDLIAVWVKNSTELIVNLGPVEQLGQGHLSSVSIPTEFNGDLVGAKFLALGVPNAKAVFDQLGFDPPPPQ